MKNKGNATIIVVIIAILILGLIVVFAVKGLGLGTNLFSKPTGSGVGPEIPRDLQVEKLNSLSNSDEVDAIEQDINATNLDDIDEDLSIVVDEGLKSL